MTPCARRELRGGTAIAAAWAGPCAHHSRDAESTGDRNRTADARAPSGRPQPGAALSIAPCPASTGARGTHLQTKQQSKLPGVAALTPVLLEASERQLRAAASWWGEASGRMLLTRLARAPPGAAASEVSALTLPPLGSAACGFPLQSLPPRVSSLSSPAPEPLKGTRDPCHVLTGAAQTSSAC